MSRSLEPKCRILQRWGTFDMEGTMWASLPFASSGTGLCLMCLVEEAVFSGEAVLVVKSS